MKPKSKPIIPPDDAKWVCVPARPPVWTWKVLPFQMSRPKAMTKLLNDLEDQGYMIWGVYVVPEEQDGSMGIVVARAYRKDD